ncbi:hypothetical protein THRCLA_09502 [Thraustotheca clavata]|uniref:Uncharacterized protein n=1 Tax=Thraustotheca clavata TaxID=74557 RepID=A0A1V9YVS6_9STRA|nr:hypothetical protein THRCLA_09502 [Thraustotheca clavata]
MADGREVLVLRLDTLRSREPYVATLKKWLQGLELHGRLVTRGSLELLVVHGSTNGVDTLLKRYETDPIQLNPKNEMARDTFYDILGRKPLSGEVKFQGFLEMQMLNDALVQKLVVDDWEADVAWIDEAKKTERSKRFLVWKEARKQQLKRERQAAAQERDAKKAQAREAKRLEQSKLKEEQDNDGDDKEETINATANEEADKIVSDSHQNIDEKNAGHKSKQQKQKKRNDKKPRKNEPHGVKKSDTSSKKHKAKKSSNAAKRKRQDTLSGPNSHHKKNAKRLRKQD